MIRSLYEYKITGVKTTIRFLERIMNCPGFRKGEYNTHFIENNNEFLLTDGVCDRETEDIALIATFAQFLSGIEERKIKNSALSEKNGTGKDNLEKLHPEYDGT